MITVEINGVVQETGVERPSYATAPATTATKSTWRRRPGPVESALLESLLSTRQTGDNKHADNSSD